MIKIKSLRSEVKNHLQNKMFNGKISFGEKISLTQLSTELGVSVTPVREALTQLAQSNIVEIIPNRGFFIPQMNTKDAIEIYEIIANLEYLAVENSDYSELNIHLLRETQDKLDKSNSSIVSLKLDFKFHEILLENYSNITLKTILHDLKIRIFLYEYHFMKINALVVNSSSNHRRIIKHIEARDLVLAANEVKENWLSSINFIKTELINHNNNQI